MPGTPHFTDTLQIGFIVRDLEETMRVYVERYGIGPWEVTEMAPPELRDLTKNDEPAAYGMRIALTMVGSVQWELVQPTTGDSIYSEFLETRGEGLHHILLGADSYTETLELFRERGTPIKMTGNFKDLVSYAYLPTDDDLGYVLEVYEASNPDLDTLLVPDAVYPSATV